MRKTGLILCTLSLSLIFGQAHAGHWESGNISKVEVFSNRISVEWDGNNPLGCGQNHVVFYGTAGSIGNNAAYERAFSTALAAAASNKKIRFHLASCNFSRQVATVVQLCTGTC